MSFDHDRPDASDPDAWEYSTDIDGATVRISKVGGGTIGRSYTGSWHYSLVGGGTGTDTEGSDLTTGSPVTHEEAAVIVADFLIDY